MALRKKFKVPQQPLASWNVIEAKRADRRMIVRVNEAVVGLIGSAKHRIKVSVAIILNSSRDDGMPTPEELAALTAAEAEILARMRGRGELVLVITTSGAREFVAYTNSTAWVDDFTHEVERAISTHKIHVESREDADWSAYLHFAS